MTNNPVSSPPPKDGADPALSPAETYRQAVEALLARDFARAIALLGRVLTHFPRHAEAHNTLGAALLGAGQIGPAAAHFQEALALNPDYREAATNLLAAFDEKPDASGVRTCYDIRRLRDFEGRRKKILVVSHERSGTHLLINAIAVNFGYLCLRIDVDDTLLGPLVEPGNFSAWFREAGDEPLSNIFKSHHPFACYASDIPEFAERFHIFYIHRDGRDVMTSFWRYANKWQWEEAPKRDRVGDFMRAPPTGKITALDRHPAPTMLARWVNHVDGWLGAGAPWATIIRYEDLLSDFEPALDTIGRALGTEPAHRTFPGALFPSIAPWKKTAGTWREYFADADRDYFQKHAGAAMARLGYEI